MTGEHIFGKIILQGGDIGEYTIRYSKRKTLLE
jgi:hypothetical protein